MLKCSKRPVWGSHAGFQLQPDTATNAVIDSPTHKRGARARLAAPGRGATRGGVERAERKERNGRKKATHLHRGGMGRYQGCFWCSLAQQCYHTGKGAASIGTRLMAAAEHTLPY